MNSPDSTLPLQPERLAVLDRLPEGVEFTLVKLILSAAPPFTRTHLWTDRESHDPLRARFRTQTYDQVDRALDKVAAALMRLPQERQPAARQQLAALRFEWASQVMGEVAGLPRLPGARVTPCRGSVRRSSPPSTRRSCAHTSPRCSASGSAIAGGRSESRPAGPFSPATPSQSCTITCAPTTMCAGTLTGFWRRVRGISRLPFAKISSIS